MINTINKIILILIIFFNATILGQEKNINSPFEIIKPVIDRVINETEFGFKLVQQEPVLGVQIIDFKKQFGTDTQDYFYALSSAISEKDTLVNIGISASPNILIFINDKKINFKSLSNPSVKEVAYGMINFDDTVEVHLSSGPNKVLVKSAGSNSKIFIRQITNDPESEGWIKFSEPPSMRISGTSSWLMLGPTSSRLEDTPEKSIKNYYEDQNTFVSWAIPKVNTLQELIISPENVFKKDSYADWNYANGETIFSILNFANEFDEIRYKNYAEEWCNFILKNLNYFRWQYDSLNALRGSYHRIFRKSMLDDAGAPVFPFAELFLETKNQNYKKLVNEMADYVSNSQSRLNDGTFCRPEPVEMTVWADDLFMSVPLLLRMGQITNDKKYFEDAAKQIINFNKLLFNKDTGLYKHCWFSKTKEKSVAFWGRANGWVIWAVTEALQILPKDYPMYSKIMSIYKEHINGLLNAQDKDGMWHQVLDHPESYEETSCTAMFVLGIARGISHGWLDDSYRESALNGWSALTIKIDSNGVVHGICRGTGVGDNLQFYFNRPTIDNDPRGLGAVITAGLEISKLLNK